jgi:nitroimidazol reductase NimA-like FMN-containing flavoprotein (pyridoxamine 5'-phosphate oxidase superfamily)
MRHRDRELKDRETIRALLERTPVGRIATINRRGFPVIKPVNFLYWRGKVYIHSSSKGEKTADIRRGSPVCFEVDTPIAYVTAGGNACSANYYYRSLIAKGGATFVNRRERKMEVLNRMMEKYQPEGGFGGISQDVLQKTAVIEIAIRKITGKEKLG